MQKKISLGTTILIVVLCCVVTLVGTLFVSFLFFLHTFDARLLQLAESNPQNTVDNEDFIDEVAARLAEVDAIYRAYYIGELDDEVLIDNIIAGYVYGTGDEYAAYYNAESLEELMSDLHGELVGIGVNVIYNEKYGLIEVINVIPDSPAEEAGLLPGDLFYTIGEEKELVSDVGYLPSIYRLRGEEGTTAVFSVLRGEKYAEEISFSVKRRKVTEVTVFPRVYEYDESIGIIKITGFDARTPEQFVDALMDITKRGCTQLVVDLRNNPGGELESIVTILDYILPKGPIIRIMDKDGNQVSSYESNKTELNMPMAVLVNDNTASAAELFTSAVRDYDKAIIVGKTTYGKGCMQTTVPLSDGGAVSVTFRMYNPPFSENYHGIGIVPDIDVELDSSENLFKISDADDNQLKAAVDALTQNSKK